MAALKIATNDYAELNDFLGSKNEKKIGHNTVARRNGEDIEIVLHWTAIVVVKPGNSVVLNSGGYRSATTKERINQFLPSGVSLFQKAGAWYLRFHATGEVVDFHDGIRVDFHNVLV